MDLYITGVSYRHCAYHRKVKHLGAWAPAGIFVGGGEPLKRPPSRRKRPPPKKTKNCAITVLRGLRGMLRRENFNNGAPYDILDASQQGRI